MKIMYGEIMAHGHVCFQLPPTARNFIFNSSHGFAFGCGFDLSVTAQPVSMDSLSHTLNFLLPGQCVVIDPIFTRNFLNLQESFVKSSFSAF